MSEFFIALTQAIVITTPDPQHHPTFERTKFIFYLIPFTSLFTATDIPIAPMVQVLHE